VRPRNTLFLLLVLAALGAYVYWVELPHEKTEATQKRLLAFDKDAVASIDLQYPDRAMSLARDDHGHWRLTKPIEADADDATVNNLLTAISEAEVSRTLDGVTDKLASYGLDPAEAAVTLGLKGGTTLPAVKVGKGTQVGFSAYARKDDDNAVLIVGGGLPTGLKKELKDLRDKAVISFDESQVQRVVIKRPNETIAVERQGDPSAETWRITTPGSYPADAAEMRSLLASIRGIRADDFASDDAAPALAPFGLDQPRLEVSVFVGKDSAQQTLLVGGTKNDPQKKTIYAKRAKRPTVYTIPEYAVKSLDKDLSTLRDKTVLAFDKAKAGKLVVTRKDGTGFTLVKRDGAWHLDAPGEGAERGPAITRFLDDVATLKGSEIVEEHAADLGKYGLATPDLLIVVSDESGAKLGTLLGTRGVAPADPNAPDAKSFATAEGSGVVFGMKPFVYDRIDKKAADMREKPATPVPSGAVTPGAEGAPPALGDEGAAMPPGAGDARGAHDADDGGDAGDDDGGGDDD
jgi:hypothetical protein